MGGRATLRAEPSWPSQSVILSRRWLAALAAAIALGGCGSADGREVTGIVTEFDGTITTVDRFVVRIDDGTDFEFSPADDLVFHGAAVGHIGEHRRTGIPVTVRYTTSADGKLVAEEIFDAG